MTDAGRYFDEDDADRAERFFGEFLTFTKGPKGGQPFHLEEWQRTIVRDLFGWKRSDGTRQYRTAFVAIPRKNGKTELVAGLGLKLLHADREMAAEVYCCAGDREQASVLYNAAQTMTKASPELDSRARVFRGPKTTTVEATGSFMRALSRESGTKHGLNPHGVLFDELHVQKDRHLWDTMRTATGARAQPLTVAITTAGYDRHSICWEVWDYAVKVRDGVIEDPSFYPVIYAADADDDWTDPETWRKANPNLGVSLREDWIEEACREAQASPAKENTFRRLHLNQWTQQDTRWLRMAAWDRCGGAIDEAELEGERCYVGLDVASTTDVAAAVAYFPDAGHAVLPMLWIPEDAIEERERHDRVPYRAWVRDGIMMATPGNVIDQDAIRRDLNEFRRRFNVVEIAADPWNATQLLTQLAGDGFEVVQFGQGFRSMNEPTKALEAMVLAGDLRHGDHPAMRWMAGNVAVETDPAGNLKPSKKRSTEKIDGIVALIMAVGRALVHRERTSAYEGRGIILL